MRTKTLTRAQETSRPGRFATVCTVALDTLVNKTYNFDVARLRNAAGECERLHPRVSKISSLATRYGFGLVLAYAERSVSRHTGPTISSSIVYSHPFVLSKSYLKLRSKIQATESKNQMDKPDMPTYSGTYAILENGSIPLYFFLLGTVASLSTKFVSPWIAAASVIIANLSAMLAEFVGFAIIWQKKVLKNIPRGGPMDMIRGFMNELHPCKFYSSFHKPNPARSAYEYIGQLWGLMESNYLWVQLSRICYAVLLTVTHIIEPNLFVDSFIGFSARYGFGIFTSIFTANYADSLSRKIEENNSELYPEVHS